MQSIKPGKLIALPFLIALPLWGCSDGSDSGPQQPEPEPKPRYDFAAIDARFQQFLDENDDYDGISYTLVDMEQGVVHEKALGEQSLDTIVLLASASKVPSVTLAMAVQDDEGLDFDVEASIDNYLPWDGVYGDRTMEQLLSNTSGIPGLGAGVGSGPDGPHSCQVDPMTTLSACAETIYTTEADGSVPPRSFFDYGGAAWQLSGGVVEQVTNSSWRQAFDNYIGEPCGMAVMQYGNTGMDWGVLTLDTRAWNGYPESLTGLDNPSIEGGGIANIEDYAKLLLLHLRGGVCDGERVLSAASVEFMQADRTEGLIGNVPGLTYAMGWWIPQNMPGVLMDFGLFGSIGWLDTERGIGGFVAVDDYTYTLLDALVNPLAPPARLVFTEIIQMQQEAVDVARSQVGEQ